MAIFDKSATSKQLNARLEYYIKNNEQAAGYNNKLESEISDKKSKGYEWQEVVIEFLITYYNGIRTKKDAMSFYFYILFANKYVSAGLDESKLRDLKQCVTEAWSFNSSFLQEDKDLLEGLNKRLLQPQSQTLQSQQGTSFLINNFNANRCQSMGSASASQDKQPPTADLAPAKRPGPGGS